MSWKDKLTALLGAQGKKQISVAEAGQLGEVKKASTYLLYVIASITLGLMVWAYFASVETVARSQGTEMRSPVSGIVNRVMVNTVGGVVKPGEPIVEVVPVDEQLVLEANVLPSDIGFVKVGQLANVKLTAYDYSIFGSLVGKVVHIAPDSVSNEKGESFYVARIETSSSMEVRGNKFEVMPGMQAQVDIITGHRTIWEYLSKPLVAVKENAFRER